jgi:CheY-like chemotaxis protein
MLWKKNSGESDRKQVLVADDSESSRDLLRFILERSGCRVIAAQDGEEALSLALSLFPDLLIIDLNMPLRDGYSVTSELRRQPAFAQTPIIALSAEVAQTDRASIAAAGFSMYLPKPVPPAQLRACLTKFLFRDSACA